MAFKAVSNCLKTGTELVYIGLVMVIPWLACEVSPIAYSKPSDPPSCKQQALTDCTQHYRDEHSGDARRQSDADARGNQDARNRAKQQRGQDVEVHVAQ